MLIGTIKRASNNYRLLHAQSRTGRFRCVALMSLQGSPWREIHAGRHWSCRRCGSVRPLSSAASPRPMTQRWNLKEFVCFCISDSCKMQLAEICSILSVYPANCLECRILAWLIYFRRLAFSTARKSSQSWMNEFQRQTSINFTIVKVLNESSNNIASECICE